MPACELANPWQKNQSLAVSSLPADSEDEAAKGHSVLSKCMWLASAFSGQVRGM